MKKEKNKSDPYADMLPLSISHLNHDNLNDPEPDL
jgi:hypothetical protein